MRHAAALLALSLALVCGCRSSPPSAPDAAPIRLTTNDASDFHPSWSPDGTRLVFASDRDGDLDLYVVAVP